MNNKQIFAVIAIIVLYYWWRAKSLPGRTASINPNTGRQRGKTGLTPSTFGASASTTPRMGRQPIGLTQANAGNGKGFLSAPVRAIASLQNPGRRNPGTGVTSGTLSRAWSGAGTAGISPTWPTRAAKANGTTVRTGSGYVQVPSYAAVPTVTRAAGGGGSIVYLGGKR